MERVSRGNQHAFTLLELMITVAILAVLVAIAYPAFREYIRDARMAEGVRMLGDVWRAQQEFSYRAESESQKYSQCFKTTEPRPECFKVGAQPMMVSLSYQAPRNSRFNLILGDGNLGIGSQSYYPTLAFFLSAEERVRMGLAGDASSISKKKFGWAINNPNEFWMGAETLIDGRLNLLGMQIDSSNNQAILLSLCENGAPGPDANQYIEGFVEDPCEAAEGDPSGGGSGAGE